MKIVIQRTNLRDIKWQIDDINRRYKEKIKKVKISIHEIEFINGDTIKFTSNQSFGLKGDVAIGVYAGYITCTSEYEKPIWDFSDLENYLRSL